MERLSCQTPAMAIKEIGVHLLAYNLSRLMMAQAALLTDRLPRQLSFTHTLHLWIAWDQHGHGIDRDEKWDGLFVLIAQHRVDDRPGPSNPGPSSDPLLMKPRAIARKDSRKLTIPRSLSKCHSALTPFSFPTRQYPSYRLHVRRRCHFTHHGERSQLLPLCLMTEGNQRLVAF